MIPLYRNASITKDDHNYRINCAVSVPVNCGARAASASLGSCSLATLIRNDGARRNIKYVKPHDAFKFAFFFVF